MTRKTKTVLYSAVFMITAISMVVLCYLKGIVPFGSKGSMAIMDAQIQYLDFFAYLKDVLNGTQKIGYTFNRTLGGNNIAVFAYYLSSPFNLLVAAGIFYCNSNFKIVYGFYDLQYFFKKSF